jgi:hypothetical protein
MKRLAPEVAAKLQEYLRTTWKANPLGLLFPGERSGKIIAMNFMRQDVLYRSWNGWALRAMGAVCTRSVTRRQV